MGRLNSSRGGRVSGTLRIRSRLALAASVATVACGLRIQVATADTTAMWTSQTSGNWTDPTHWSTNPNYPNNGTPVGTDYQALIDATGLSPFTVTLNSNVSLDGLSLNSSKATLSQTGGTLQVNTLGLNAGSYTINGGTLTNSDVVEANGDALIVQSGTLNGVTVQGGNVNLASYGSSSTVQNGISIPNGSLDLPAPNLLNNAGSTAVTFDGASQTINGFTIQDVQVNSSSRRCPVRS